MPRLDPQLEALLEQDKLHLENTQIPMVTVSATFREDLKGWYGLAEDDNIPDVVLSRAHFSMAMGVAIEAWGKKVNPDKAWLVDPTNYVSSRDWKSLQLTQSVGRLLARQPLLKMVKDVIDRFGRQKLPILKSITPPIVHLFERVDKPVLSLHIAAGNILVEHGKHVIQVITDPHVRDDYLTNADNSRITFCVFDDRTKLEFLEKAAVRGLKVDPDKVIVTGPPLDPRVREQRFHKSAWKGHRPLRLCITTGGLGTNKDEIHRILEQMLPELRRQHPLYQILVYAGTQTDIAKMSRDLAHQHRVKIGGQSDARALFRILYHPQIVDANELLIEYGFPWADGFISKPSGDMAYDAAAAGCFLLTLAEWGEWEHNIREIFVQKGIAQKAETDHIVAQLSVLTQRIDDSNWVENAQCAALEIDELFLNGSQKILASVLER
ncbi:MAG TPA: hypothetical protein VD999_01665 [Vitreimonas sp.]|nr:hypothetical protein [Vitreimonas sp.]